MLSITIAIGLISIKVVLIAFNFRLLLSWFLGLSFTFWLHWPPLMFYAFLHSAFWLISWTFSCYEPPLISGCLSSRFITLNINIVTIHCLRHVLFTQIKNLFSKRVFSWFFRHHSGYPSTVPCGEISNFRGFFIDVLLFTFL